MNTLILVLLAISFLFILILITIIQDLKREIGKLYIQICLTDNAVDELYGEVFPDNY